MEAALKAIAAPRRRQILTLVRDGELSAGEIAAHFDVTRPAVSQHLTVLKEAGLVDERRNGPRRLYRARPEGLADVKEFLEKFWDERLGGLKREGGEENPVPPGSSRIEIELEPSGDGTLLRFRHSGLPNSETVRHHAHGWDHYLQRLAVAGRGDDPGEDRGPEAM